MRNELEKDKPGWASWFADWEERLVQEAVLPPGLRESYRATFQAFLGFCRRRQSGPTVAAARDYVEIARLERQPGPVQLQEWKDALNWFFRAGQKRSAEAGECRS